MEALLELEFLGKNTRQFFGSEQVFAEILEMLLKNGSWFEEITLLKTSSTPFYALIWINLVKDNNGKPIRLMASYIEITNRKQMEI